MTKLCTDPWARIFIRVDGGVCLCCVAPPVGNLHEESLKNIIKGENWAAYKIGLLTGELQPRCKTCSAKPNCTLEEEEQAVRQYLTTGKELPG